VFNALLQSSAAKQAATQKAMKSASDNADNLITDYTRLRNNARQAEITQQIAEIVGGADALASRRQTLREGTNTWTPPLRLTSPQLAETVGAAAALPSR